jgi:hypothetical protein
MEKYYNDQIKILMNLKKQKEAELEAIKKKLRELILKTK